MSPRIAFIGAGRLAQSLAPVLAEQGESLTAIASRDPAAAQRLADQLPGVHALPAADCLAVADIVFLSTPDDAIAALTASLPWRRGQAAVHCSGATGLDALDAARRAGAMVGGFHPLQIFSDPRTARERLKGSVVAIETPDAPLGEQLHRLAGRLGLRPLALGGGQRAAYHAAANIAASGVLAMLSEAVSLFEQLGLAPDQALAALMPLSRGALDAATQRGLAGAIAGPVARGDARVLAAHLQVMASRGEDALQLYRWLCQRQLDLLADSGRPDTAARAALGALLARPAVGESEHSASAGKT
ncbi:DUF2520 domain-containing protein [Mitsuaria sp. WAJ17]|uniref:Rossmann-like and DUF2520 domain-containing protein n=1 Tax=Mitsuaria sp. WAJ17 TaxID=2761452 RepID=UPI0016044B16|nr:DUF2520 domain-containing protein [Mitsuaria sp. WAJ17]MBB2484094.1 DUF2520 domain-containing protein [Mitsuaria sp. WAJ17]